jgi:hypothetical protein
MLNFLLLMLLPIAIAIGVLLFFRGKVTLAEFGMQLGVVALLMLTGIGIAYYESTSDVEIWNGQIAAKNKVRVSCSHSYSCNCRQSCSGSGKSESCTTICDTCYEHSFDYSWRVSASTGESLDIDRVDRQGLLMPPRWGAAFLGEPFSSSHTYTNYILANPDSVLLGGKGDVEKFKALIPQYPKVYDYYRANHLINLGVADPQSATNWSWLLNEANKRLGTAKQVNLLLVLAATDDPAYVTALKEAWVGGKKNDAVVVIGSIDGHRIAFADVLSWTPAQDYKIAIRDGILDIGTLDARDEIVGLIAKETEAKFVRMHMKDFAYLTRSFQPSQGAMVFLFLLGIASTIGLAVWSVVNDITDEPAATFRRRYSY